MTIHTGMHVGIQPWPNYALFQTLNLTNTADLTAWLTKYSGSYTCGAEWSVADFEGVFNPVRTNIAPYYGARRVENLITYSRDISNADWIKAASSAVIGTDTWQAGAQYDYVHNIISTISGYRYTFSFTAHTSGRTTDIRFRHTAASEGNSTVLPLSGSARRYSVTITGTGANISYGLIDYNTADWVEIIITDIQVENITGQANQNPSNHIATTTAAVTEYYTTENANTVSSNVVTEATGDPIENIMGLAFWPTTTNVIGSAQYRDFTHIDWNKINGSITAGDVVLIDGTTVADKNTFTASAANATLILTPYVSLAGVHAGGIFVKRKTGTDLFYVTMDAGVTWVDKTTELDSDAGWHLTETTLSSIADPEFGIKLAGSGDAVYLDWAQMDDGYARVSSHPIVGGVTLSGQDLHFNNNNLIADKQGYVIAEAMLMPDDLSLVTNAVVYNGQYVLYSGSDGDQVRNYDGTNIKYLSGGFNEYSKAASYWWDSLKQVSANASSSTSGPYDGDWGTGVIYIGSVGGAANWNGILSKVIFGYNIKTTQAKMEVATTPGCHIPIDNVRVVDSEGEYLEDENGECIYTSR